MDLEITYMRKVVDKVFMQLNWGGESVKCDLEMQDYLLRNNFVGLTVGDRLSLTVPKKPCARHTTVAYITPEITPNIKEFCLPKLEICTGCLQLFEAGKPYNDHILKSILVK